MLLLMLVNGSLAYGQSSASSPRPATDQKVVVDQEFLIEAEKAIADRQRLQAVTAAQAEALTAKDQQIAALRGLLQIQQQISADWKEAATARKDALKTDDKLILQYDKRVAELQAERDAAKRNGRLFAVGGFVFGVLAGVFAAKN
jgi:hypothetical protein